MASRSRVLEQLVGGQPGISPRLLVPYAAVWGATGGLGEAAFRTGRQILLHQPGAGYYADLLWMAPLSGTLAATLLAAPVALLSRVVGVRVGLAKVTLALAFAACYGVIRLDGIPFYPAAEVVLAAGLATVLTRAVVQRASALRRSLPRVRWAAAGGAAVLALFALLQRPTVEEWIAGFGKPEATPGAPNVLLIIPDTVRGANLGLYGYHRPTTPEIARWAAEGTAFERAISTAPWTLPSHASLFTGRYHYQLGTGPYRALGPEPPTLATVLGEHGYATAGFAANFGYTTEMSGLARGFDRYEAIPIDLGQLASSSWLSDLVYRPVRLWTGSWYLQKSVEQVRTDFEEWLDHHALDRPFFAFLNVFDAHDPYVSPAPYDTLFGPSPGVDWSTVLQDWMQDPGEEYGPERLERWVNRYDGAIAYIDSQLGLLRRELDSRGLLDNTLVVITADHGEMWGRHGQILHAQGLYDPVLRVPLVMVLPGVVPNARIDTLVSTRDVAATILELAGVPAGSGVPGTPLTTLWATPGSRAPISPALAETDRFEDGHPWAPAARGDMRSLYRGRLHYILNGDGVEELYDVIDDPWETHDLADTVAFASALNRFQAMIDSLR